MNILLSGATGFIGMHLLRRLVEDGHDCRCLVRRKEKSLGISFSEKVQVVEGDITKPASLRDIGRNMDVAYHLAGAGHVSSVHDKEALEAVAINVQGTRNFAEACGRDGVRRFIHFSSTAAMGLIKSQKIDETAPCQPATPYQKSKYESESAASEQAERFGMELLVLRPCMVYGPGGKGEFLKFCRLIQRGVFPRLGSGKNLTPIVHVRDVVAGAVNALHLGENGQIYLIASKSSYPMAELFNYICGAMNFVRPYVYVPVWAALSIAFVLERISVFTGKEPVVSRKNIVSTVTGRIFDIGKASMDLAYSPEVDIRSGIKETVAWFKKSGLL
ncbi:MAG: NAD-dependent epimerase/dehydratase family protein [Deltaproteobacteria bacterium]|nr:NAD-dependent epimerase/dehydratase family protein [Deltaproteobacteria bacterium]MBW1817721.1 NAD-dependent epimerase/dehydratase family protein [Deltaproteobacteria bacterium]